MFALAVRWGATSGMGPGKIELYLLSTTGILSAPLLVTDQSGSDFASNKAFGLASRSDGTLMVVWHTCPEGPGSCDVFGSFVNPSFANASAPFVVPTNTASDQVNPSVAAHGDVFVTAWTDSSGVAPDTSGTAVRARITEPEL